MSESALKCHGPMAPLGMNYEGDTIALDDSHSIDPADQTDCRPSIVPLLLRKLEAAAHYAAQLRSSLVSKKIVLEYYICSEKRV